MSGWLVWKEDRGEPTKEGCHGTPVRLLCTAEGCLSHGGWMLENSAKAAIYGGGLARETGGLWAEGQADGFAVAAEGEPVTAKLVENGGWLTTSGTCAGRVSVEAAGAGEQAVIMSYRPTGPELIGIAGLAAQCIGLFVLSAARQSSIMTWMGRLMHIGV